jgi:nucleotide-binding universal stress UspA family protein
MGRPVPNLPWLPWTRARATVSSDAGATYHAMLVPVTPDFSETMVATAGELAASRDAIIEVITVIEVPIAMPLDAALPEVETTALDALDRARRIAEDYGVRVITYSVRARHAGRAIVDEAAGISVEVIILSAPAERLPGRPLMGSTADFVLRHRPCRVIVAIDAPGETSRAVEAWPPHHRIGMRSPILTRDPTVTPCAP